MGHQTGIVLDALFCGELTILLMKEHIRKHAETWKKSRIVQRGKPVIWLNHTWFYKLPISKNDDLKDLKI